MSKNRNRPDPIPDLTLPADSPVAIDATPEVAPGDPTLTGQDQREEGKSLNEQRDAAGLPPFDASPADAPKPLPPDNVTTVPAAGAATVAVSGEETKGVTLEEVTKRNVLAQSDQAADAGTLRDTFAQHALVGLLSGPFSLKPGEEEKHAREAYALADAMLKARDKKKDDPTAK